MSGGLAHTIRNDADRRARRRAAESVVGASNVKAALELHATLEHRAMRALLGMAVTAYDPGKAPAGKLACRYFGGREGIAEILGRPLPPEPLRSDMTSAATEARRARQRAFKIVEAVMRELREHRAMTVIVDAHNGRRAEYELHLDPRS
ncbi:hypothetical protein [Cellulomonas chitinilytica]|uniref:hypothetical protein n=1 Tax=Cellulomonas chitinilytica TaxID=398759 RepID=UPI0019436746|nr:hypothetical protein [Cellulomonas chitinilytica]